MGYSVSQTAEVCDVSQSALYSRMKQLYICTKTGFPVLTMTIWIE